jgi:hypothetical protein
MLLCAPLAGIALAAQLSPHAATAQSEPPTATETRRDMREMYTHSKDEIPRLTGLLALVDKERTAASAETRARYDTVHDLLTDARTRHAIIARDLAGGAGPMNEITARTIHADWEAAKAATQRAEDVYREAQRQTEVPTPLPDPTPPPPTVSSATESAPAPALFRVLTASAPTTPTPAPVAASPAPEPAQAPTEAPSAPQPVTTDPPVAAATPDVAESPEPASPPAPRTAPRSPEPASTSGPPHRSTSDAPPPPSVAVARPAPSLRATPEPRPQPGALAPASLSNPLSTLDPPPLTTPRGTTVATGDTLGRTLPTPPTVEMTGPAALPPPGTPPFHRGGAADWSPALNPLARPPGDPSVIVHPEFAGPTRSETLPPPVQSRAYASDTTRRTRPLEMPPPAEPALQGPDAMPDPPVPDIAAPTAPSVARVPQAAVPPPPVEPDTGPATAPVAPPPQAPIRQATPPQPAATGPIQPFTLDREAPGGNAAPKPDDTRAQFAEIAGQVSAHYDKTRDLLGQIDPVRADLTQRMESLPPGDPRRAGMEEVRTIIDTAESDLKAAETKYGALSEQLRIVLDLAPGSPVTWTPRDAARQAIAASTKANQGVNGLKQAMARFEEVMTQRTTRLTPGALAQ